MPEQGIVVGVRHADAWQRFARHNQDVGGCLGGNVVKGDAELIFMDEGGGDFLVADFFEEGFVGHEDGVGYRVEKEAYQQPAGK